jgi:hypothetical protein
LRTFYLKIVPWYETFTSEAVGLKKQRGHKEKPLGLQSEVYNHYDRAYLL